MATFKKADQEVLDFGIDWSDLMTDEGLTISTSTWSVPAGIVSESDSFSGTATTITLSGGTVGEVYKLVNYITTSGVPTFERTFFVFIVEDKFR